MGFLRTGLIFWIDFLGMIETFVVFYISILDPRERDIQEYDFLCNDDFLHGL